MSMIAARQQQVARFIDEVIETIEAPELSGERLEHFNANGV